MGDTDVDGKIILKRTERLCTVLRNIGNYENSDTLAYPRSPEFSEILLLGIKNASQKEQFLQYGALWYSEQCAAVLTGPTWCTETSVSLVTE